MSISNLLGMSRQAMSAYQNAIDVTAQNVSNVSVEGYTRRRANVGAMLSGGGSNLNEFGAAEITRIQSDFVQRQLWEKNQILGKHESDEFITKQIEVLFNEPTDAGLSNTMTQFWNSWDDLSNDPENNTVRAIVKDKGEILSNTFRQVSNALNGLNQEIKTDIAANVSKINQLLKQIKTINEQVKDGGNHKLSDQRDVAITELSQLINIDVSVSENNTVNISTSGDVRVSLVRGNFINEIAIQSPRSVDGDRIELSFSEGGNMNSLNGGKLGSLVQIHNEKVPDYLGDLDSLAVALAEKVNEIHTSGYNLSNVTGINFFSDTVTGASDMLLNSAISADPTLIATSTFINQPGNADIARGIVNLQHETMLEKQTFSDFYNATISKVGSHAREAGFLADSQELVVQALANQRDSVSGVSIDEEMVNLVKYEQAYKAASRMVNVVNELYNSVLTLL